MTPNPTPMHTEKPGFSTLFVKSGVQNRWELQFRRCTRGAAENAVVTITRLINNILREYHVSPENYPFFEN